MLINKSISFIREINVGELAIFCGAGISANSGLPLAHEIKLNVLKRLPTNKDIDHILKSNIPFESFIQILSENSDISKIINVFKIGKPNTNHVFIAKLVKYGIIKTIFTTNFDLLLEKAFENEGLVREKDFDVYYDEDQFSNIKIKTVENRTNIFKIHGSIENEQSIRASINLISRKLLLDKRYKIIDSIFSKGKHKGVLILGYSNSDQFDIIPRLLNITSSRKQIIFIDHIAENKISIEDINTQTPFFNFPGKKIKINTNIFIKTLWQQYKDIFGDYAYYQYEEEFEQFFDDWHEDFRNKKDIKYNIAAQIYVYISNYTRAIESYKKALQFLKKISSERRKAECLSSLGVAYRENGKLNNAINCHKSSLNISIRSNNKINESRSLELLGICLHDSGKIFEAIGYYKKSLAIAKNIKEIYREIRCLKNLGAAYNDLDDYSKSEHYFTLALNLSIEQGDKFEEAECYSYLGNLLNDLGHFYKAIDSYNNSLKIAKLIGDKANELKSHIGFGAAYNNLGIFHKAKDHYNIALEIAINIEDKMRESRSYAYLGEIHHNLKDYSNAIKYYENSKNISQKIGNSSDYIRSIVGLGFSYSVIGKYEKAIKFFNEALTTS